MFLQQHIYYDLSGHFEMSLYSKQSYISENGHNVVNHTSKRADKETHKRVGKQATEDPLFEPELKD